MPKRNTAQTILFAGAVAFGAAAFVGGYRLRGSTDPVARVSRDRTASTDGYVVSREDRQAQIPLSDFYSAMTDLLKKEYVEPIGDDQKLASGAVRGMVLSLGDPRCVYMDKDEFRAFLNAREGRYEGIGAEFAFEGYASKPKAKDPDGPPSTDDPHEAVLMSRVPDLVVSMVVPGGPADKAGVKVGDVASEIDGHWVVDDAEIVRFNKARADFAAKRIPFSAIAKLQGELKKKAERALMPAKAKDRLALGAAGTVKVVWRRGTGTVATTLTKAPSELSPFAVKDRAYTMRFDAETAGRLRTALAGKEAVALDLRNNVDGDFESMRRALAVLAPDGAYGAVVSKRKEDPMPFTVKDGNAKPPKITIRVDRTTQGPAAILARALASRGLATLEGAPGSDLAVRTLVRLPDGTGYTLVTGEWAPTVPAPRSPSRRTPREPPDDLRHRPGGPLGLRRLRFLHARRARRSRPVP